MINEIQKYQSDFPFRIHGGKYGSRPPVLSFSVSLLSFYTDNRKRGRRERVQAGMVWVTLVENEEVRTELAF